MFTYIQSNFSQIINYSLPTGVLSNTTEGHSKIVAVASTIFCSLAALALIFYYFKCCELDPEESTIPPHISPKPLTPPTQSVAKSHQSNPKVISPVITDEDITDEDEEFAKALQKSLNETDKPSNSDKQIEDPIHPFKPPLNNLVPIHPTSKKDSVNHKPMSPSQNTGILPHHTRNAKLEYEMTKKMYKGALLPQEMKFTPLSESQVRELLKIEPTLQTRMAARGRYTAFKSITDIHKYGVPTILTNQTVNNELIQTMQFILYTINQQPTDKKKKESLIELAESIEDCLPVTQGNLALIHMKHSSVGGFDKQIECFISSYKERLFDEVIYEVCPQLKNPQLAKIAQGKNDFPHIKTGFKALLGDELGVNMTGVREDPNKNTFVAEQKKGEFKKLFYQLISIQDVIKEFIIDVNGRNDQIELNTFSRWCVPENLGNEEAYNVFYDETFEYPSYSPAYKDDNRAHLPYLTERSAYLIFEKLGYLHKKG